MEKGKIKEIRKMLSKMGIENNACVAETCWTVSKKYNSPINVLSIKEYSHTAIGETLRLVLGWVNGRPKDLKKFHRMDPYNRSINEYRIPLSLIYVPENWEEKRLWKIEYEDDWKQFGEFKSNTIFSIFSINGKLYVQGNYSEEGIPRLNYSQLCRLYSAIQNKIGCNNGGEVIKNVINGNTLDLVKYHRADGLVHQKAFHGIVNLSHKKLWYSSRYENLCGHDSASWKFPEEILDIFNELMP